MLSFQSLHCFFLIRVSNLDIILFLPKKLFKHTVSVTLLPGILPYKNANCELSIIIFVSGLGLYIYIYRERERERERERGRFHPFYGPRRPLG